jgi:NAD(P)-dependent dehydrogenase (short-subunit alcohol dehydrogenase family)
MASVRGRLVGKRAVVVGAGQSPGETIGIGRATSLLYAQAGATVLLVDRDEASAVATQTLIDGDGGSAIVHCADITAEEGCRSIAAAALEALGGIDVLQNTVGIHGSGDAVEITEAFWDEVMQTNLKGMWMTCKHVVPLMRRQRAGSVINVSSMAALGGGVSAYAASKAGVNSLTRTMALSSARYGVRINAIMPGLLDTAMGVDGNARLSGADRREVEAKRAALCPMGFEGTAWDAAYLSLFLASDEARYISGACIPVDGALGTSWFVGT